MDKQQKSLLFNEYHKPEWLGFYHFSFVLYNEKNAFPVIQFHKQYLISARIASSFLNEWYMIEEMFYSCCQWPNNNIVILGACHPFWVIYTPCALHHSYRFTKLSGLNYSMNFVANKLWVMAESVDERTFRFHFFLFSVFNCCDT